MVYDLHRYTLRHPCNLKCYRSIDRTSALLFAEVDNPRANCVIGNIGFTRTKRVRKSVLKNEISLVSADVHNGLSRIVNCLGLLDGRQYKLGIDTAARPYSAHYLFRGP